MLDRISSRLRRIAGPLGLMAAAALAGCSGGSKNGAEADAGGKRDPEIVLELAPLSGQDELAVTVRMTGPTVSGVKELRVARAWADTKGADVVHDVELYDVKGPLRAGQTHDDGPDRVYPLTRPPVGDELVLKYRATGSGGRAGDRERASRLALRVGRDRVSGVGHSFLLLPPVDSPIPAKIRWSLGALGPEAAGASSFGVGAEVKTIATAEDLAHAVYVAGRLGVAESGAGTRMVMVGNPELDVGAVLEWTRGVEERARRFFEGAEAAPGEATKSAAGPAGQAAPAPKAMLDAGANFNAATKANMDPNAGAGAEPFSFIMVAEPGMGHEHDGAHLTRSLGLWFDEARALDPRLRIAIAHEIIHGWIGAGVRLFEEESEEKGSPQRDAAWFSEGFTTHYARYLLFKERLITPNDFIEDLRRSLDPEGAAEGRGRHEGYSRGALYAAYLDAALRKRSGGLRSLDDIVRELYATAAREGKPRLPASLFRDLVVRELGPEGGDDFDRLIARASLPVEPPSGAFGPCFRRADRKEPMFELGFDPASLRGDPILIRGLVKGSAADRAGLREGDLALSAKVPEPSVVLSKKGKGRDVVLSVSGRRGARKIRYKPIGERNVMRWEAKRCKQ